MDGEPGAPGSDGFFSKPGFDVVGFLDGGSPYYVFFGVRNADGDLLAYDITGGVE